MARPSAPRFLNFGDRAELPVVLQNQTDRDVIVNVPFFFPRAKRGICFPPAENHVPRFIRNDNPARFSTLRSVP